MSGEVKSKKKFAKGKGKKAEEAVAEDNGISLSAGNYRVSHEGFEVHGPRFIVSVIIHSGNF